MRNGAVDSYYQIKNKNNKTISIRSKDVFVSQNNTNGTWHPPTLVPQPPGAPLLTTCGPQQGPSSTDTEEHGTVLGLPAG